MLRAEIYINLKKTVVDPQGTTIKHALESMGYHQLEEVRIGKLVTVTFRTDDKKKAEDEIKQMCKKLLSNPIIEDFHYKLEEVT